MSLPSPVALVAVVCVVLGAALLVAPQRWARALETGNRAALQALGGALRVVLGVTLMYGARGTAYPVGVFAFGVALVGVGVAILWVDEARFSRWVDGWIAGSLTLRLRTGGLLSIVIGALLWIATTS